MRSSARIVAGLSLCVSLLGATTPALGQRPVDLERALAAEALLYRHPELWGVEVQSMMGFLYLRGHAPNEEAAQKAVDLVSQGKGIQEVRNRIRVREQRPAHAPDAEIAVRVAEIVGAVPGLDATVRDGGVALQGDVPDAVRAHDLVVELRRVEGIRTLELAGLSYVSSSP